MNIHEAPVTAMLATTAGQAIPLIGVHVTGEVVGGIARTVVRQRYKNAEARPIEAVYTFPLPSEAALVGFSMTCAGRRMEGVVREREAAFLAYDDAVSKGHGAALVDEERRNVFTASVGNLLPGEETVIEVEILERLGADEGALRWCLPTLVAPRYMPGSPVQARSAHGTAQPTTVVPDADRISPPMGAVDYGLSLDVRFLLGAGVTLESPSHAIHTEPVEGGQRVTFASNEVSLDRDVIVSARGGDTGVVTALAHKEEGQDGYVAVSVVPDLFAHAKGHKNHKVVFVVDISGSMQGSSIDQAKRALSLCLRQLREGDLFNVVAFNESHWVMSPTLVPFSQKTLDQADAVVSSLEANGGTEMLQPLLTAAMMAAGGIVVLLTDGQVGNEAQILAEVLPRTAGARVYTFGIGTNVSEMLLRDLAKRTDGACEMIYPGERIDDKVIAQFARATAARVVGVTMKTPGLDLGETSPSALANLVDGEPWMVFARYAQAAEGAVELRGTLDGEPFFLRVPVSLPARAEHGAVKKLWARERIRELEGASVSGRRADANAARIVALALEHGLSSSRTSMVVIETREGDRRAQGIPETRVVPVNAPHGWAMFQRPQQLTRSGVLGSPLPAGGAMPGAARVAAISRSSPAPRSVPAPAAFAPPPAAASQGGPPPGVPMAPQRPSLEKKKGFVAGLLDRFSSHEDMLASDEEISHAAEKAHDAGVLSRQLASGLWDDAKLAGDLATRLTLATAAALLELYEAGVTTAHAVYGAQVKKAVEALLAHLQKGTFSPEITELALSAAWLVAAGARSRATVGASLRSRGLSFADDASVRSRALSLAQSSMGTTR